MPSNLVYEIGRFFSRLFRRAPRDPDATVEERWSTRFSRFGDPRFREESSEAYSVRIVGGELRLTAHRRNLFAWTDDHLYRYGDFVVTADICFEEPTGSAAAGLLFRKSDESTFYYALVSTDGRFRFDVVFNGNPRTLIDWTECEKPTPSRPFRLRVIARGSHFSLYLEEEWIGEIVDETIPSGMFAFAVQNYDAADSVCVALREFAIDSRPIEVEAAFYRWTSYIPVDPDRRVRLARTFVTMGQFGPAGGQLRRAAGARTPSAEERYLSGLCRLNLGMRREALEEFSAAIEADPTLVEAIVEKANVLYLENRFLELREFLDAHRDAVDALPGVWNLAGNCSYALGDWERAASEYERAVEIQPEIALFHANAGRAYEHARADAQAFREYLAASRLFLADEAYDDLAALLARMERLDPDNRETISLKAKLAFQRREFDSARRLLEMLAEEESDDSAVYYLLGILRSMERKRPEADECFGRATALEPDYPLYRFRRAENRFLCGMDPGEDLRRAIDLSPEDPWVHNLAGLVALDQEKSGEAVAHFKIAVELDPGEPEIAANLAEALDRDGKTAAAHEVLAHHPESAVCRNRLGKLFASDGKYEEAAEQFRKAAAIDPDQSDYRENLAEAYYQCDMIHQAEEIAAALVEESPTATRLNLIGHIATEKGEHARAESAYLEALRFDPDNGEIACNLAEHYLRMGAYEQAEALLSERSSDRHDDRTERLRRRLREATKTRVVCATCHREWWAPKRLEPQPRIKLFGEPPEESPAGKCPVCGAVYCVGCASRHVRDGRFVCPGCDRNLTLADDRLKYLVSDYV